METKAVAIMAKLLVLSRTFLRHGSAAFRTQLVPAEPVLPPDQYHPAMVGYVLSLDFGKSELPLSMHLMS